VWWVTLGGGVGKGVCVEEWRGEGLLGVRGGKNGWRGGGMGWGIFYIVGNWLNLGLGNRWACRVGCCWGGKKKEWYRVGGDEDAGGGALLVHYGGGGTLMGDGLGKRCWLPEEG